MAPATLAALLALCAAAGAELHHIAADDGNAHHTMDFWRREHGRRHGKRHYVVKFAEKVTCADIQRGLGGDVEVEPVPPNGHALYATLDDILSLKYKATWLREVEHRHKLSSSVEGVHRRAARGANATRVGDAGARKHSVVVTASEVVDFATVLAARGVDVVSAEYIAALRAHIKFATAGDASRAVPLLAGMHAVRWVEDGHRTADPLNAIATWTVQSDVENQRPFWDAGLDGTGELVVVGDTGLDHDMCFFNDAEQSIAKFPETNLAHRKVISYFAFSEDGVYDESDQRNAHGTHVAGSVAGNSNGAHADSNGLAKNAKIFVHDFAPPKGGILLPPDLTTYYTPGHSVGARVSSNSWGSDGAPKVYEGTDIETDRFMWNHQDFLAVFASGNSRTGGILSPANAKNSLSVGAHENNVLATQRDVIAGYSAQGPTFDGRVKPDIMGPGGPVNSARSDGNLHSRNCALVGKSGTSMAAPFVAGAVLLTRQYFRDGYYQAGVAKGSPGFVASNTLMKAMVVHSGEGMHGRLAHGGDALPDNTQGYGRMTMQNVLYLASGDGAGARARNHLHVVNNATMKQGEQHTTCFRVTRDPVSRVLGVRATLVFMDPPAAVGSTHALVNDLDLVLQSPDGRLHYANSKTTYERNSNVERIQVDLVEGVYRAFVVGYHIHETHPYDGVPYSLVLTGPGIEELDGAACAGEAKCPEAPDGAPMCSGHGSCNDATKLCDCEASHTHVTCDLCDSQTLCSGHGTCSEDTLVCTCDEHTIGENCGTCEAGWFGPDCDGDCQCVHGTCNEATGRCSCFDTNAIGHWAGRHCDLCAYGFRGPECKDKSWWCENNEVVKVTDLEGWIQINGGPRYKNGMICRWLLDVPDTWPITFTFTDITVEQTYDYVKIMRGRTEGGTPIFTQTGHSGERVVESTGGPMFIKFLADQIQDDVGFNLHFKVHAKCVDGDSSTCNNLGECHAGVCDCVNKDVTNDPFCVPPPTGRPTLPPDTLPPKPLPTLAPGGGGGPNTETPVVPTLAPLPLGPNDCAKAEGGIICGGNGDCVDIGAPLAGCRCHTGFAGRYCEYACPKGLHGTAACSDRGICNADGACECTDGFWGEACQWCEGLLCIPKEAALHKPTWVWLDAAAGAMLRVASSLNSITGAAAATTGARAHADTLALPHEVSEMTVCLAFAGGEGTPGALDMTIWSADGTLMPIYHEKAAPDAPAPAVWCVAINGTSAAYIIELHAPHVEKVRVSVVDERAVGRAVESAARAHAMEERFLGHLDNYSAVAGPTAGPNTLPPDFDSYLHSDTAAYVGTGFVVGFLVMVLILCVWEQRRRSKLLLERALKARFDEEKKEARRSGGSGASQLQAAPSEGFEDQLDAMNDPSAIEAPPIRDEEI